MVEKSIRAPLGKRCTFPKKKFSHLPSGQYIVSVYRFVKEWRKNPHWSFSCCLDLLLPLIDFQGELSDLGGGLAESQLKSGNMEMPTLLVAAEESDDVETQLEEKESEEKHGEPGKPSNDGTMETRECNFPGMKLNKFNQETQTELLMLLSM